MNVDQMRDLIRREYREALDNGGVVAAYLFDDRVTALILASDPDVEQMVRRLVHNVRDAESRARRQGVRTSEIVTDAEGIRVDVTHQQLVIPQLFERGQAKVDHGNASAAEGTIDIAVATECARLARARGMDPLSTLVGMVMSREEEITFRDELRRAA